MSDWGQKTKWADVPGMSMADAKRAVKKGARLIVDEESFQEIADLHDDLAAQGCSDEEIADATCAMLDARKKALH